MNIDCTIVLKGFDDQPMREIEVDKGGKQTSCDLTLGKALSTILIQEQTGFDQAKAYSLCQRFYLEPFVELDDPDMAKLRTAVEASRGFNVLAKGRILDALKVLGEV